MRLDQLALAVLRAPPAAQPVPPPPALEGRCGLCGHRGPVIARSGWGETCADPHACWDRKPAPRVTTLCGDCGRTHWRIAFGLACGHCAADRREAERAKRALPEPHSILVGSDSGAPVVVSWWRGEPPVQPDPNEHLRVPAPRPALPETPQTIPCPPCKVPARSS